MTCLMVDVSLVVDHFTSVVTLVLSLDMKVSEEHAALTFHQILGSTDKTTQCTSPDDHILNTNHHKNLIF
jgi:hypothetical protein